MVLGPRHQLGVDADVFKHRLERKMKNKIFINNDFCSKTLKINRAAQRLTFTTSSKVSMFSFML